nr:MAG TPA: hypothetical protein [Bacteriophage sp.]
MLSLTRDDNPTVSVVLLLPAEYKRRYFVSNKRMMEV